MRQEGRTQVVSGQDEMTSFEVSGQQLRGARLEAARSGGAARRENPVGDRGQGGEIRAVAVAGVSKGGEPRGPSDRPLEFEIELRANTCS